MLRSGAFDFFEHAAEIKSILISDLPGDVLNALAAVMEQVFGSLDPKLLNVMMNGNACIFFEHLTEVFVLSLQYGFQLLSGNVGFVEIVKMIDQFAESHVGNGERSAM
jgi:hypothetical protein